MSFTTISIRDLVDQAVRGQLDVPEFQRDFVWRPDQVRTLVDSLYRDYPIGQILTWTNPSYSAPRGPSGTPASRVWLVDGQQRTTALCLMFGNKPYWWTESHDWDRRLASTNVLADLLSPGPDPEFRLANPVRAADPRWVLVRDIVSHEGDGPRDPIEAYLTATARGFIEKLPPALAASASEETVTQRLRAIRAIRDRLVALSEVHHEIEDVTEIFTRLNQQGTAVVESDVSLAVAAGMRPGWIREEFLPFLKNLSESGYDLEPGVVLRTLTAIGEGRVRLNSVSADFWAGGSFTKHWAQSKASLSAVVSGLAGAGLLSSTLLPSHTVLIPLTVLHAKYGSEGFHFPRALHWLLSATRDGRYSGASTSALDEDVRAIRAADEFPEALEALRQRLEIEVRVSPDEFLTREAWNRPMALLLYVTIFHRKATDWVTRLRVGFPRAEGALEYGFVPYWHRFFPTGRSVLRAVRFDYSEDEIGSLANVVFLNQKPPDRTWVTTPPSKYVQEASVYNHALESQMIALDRTLWDPERYRDFLAERAKLCARETNAYLASLLGSVAASDG
ncbi:MAG TPA: DUF262 domain-containing protein [Thermoplasmata archaeon]|nr:DUF262 domain-containing protein [Thermoplasmata archaeon]